MQRIIPAVLAAVALVFVAVGPANAEHGATSAAKKKSSKAKSVTIKVGDNYYTPPKVKIRVGDTLKFQWPEYSDTHDVALEKGDGPKGAKLFKSPTYGGSNAVWKTKLTKPGKYLLVCTFHADMTMTVNVAK